jgi:hypothetical protein
MSFIEIMQASEATLRRRLEQLRGSINADQEAEASLIRKEISRRRGGCAQ